MKIIIGIIVGIILLFDYCVFKVSSNISKIEDNN